MWECPLCEKLCKYGTMGCDDPLICEEEKNIHFANYLRGRDVHEQRGIGISEIAENSERPE